MTDSPPFREPLRQTLTRTVGIALVAGGVIAYSRRDLAQWPAMSTLALWPSLGGHCVELWFLNWVRPRLPRRRALQVVSRLAAWFVGGIVLAAGVWITAAAFPSTPKPRAAWWWIAGLAFVGVELMAHLALQLRGRPIFYNGRG